MRLVPRAPGAPRLLFVACAAWVALHAACAPSDDGPRAVTTPPDGEEPELCYDFVGGPRAVQLLTRAEIDRTLRDLLGDDTAPARASLPPESVLIGYENDADAHRASPLFLEGLLRMAEDVSARALAERRARVVPCDEAEIGESACGAMVVDVLGPLAYRRPLSDGERARLTGVFEASLPQWGFDTAVSLTLQAMLLSPSFLYRVDLAQSAGVDGDVTLAGPYEMASRLSYLLWGSMPDAALFEAAASGALLDVDEIERHARRMLEDPRARDATASFFRQWLALDRIDGIAKDEALFPELDDTFDDRLHASLLAFVQGVVWGGSATLEELLLSEVLWVDEVTAPLYGVAPPVNEAPIVARAAPAGTRAGLLTHPAMMSMLAGPDQSSPVRRGVWVREKLLCQPLDPPPANVVIEPPVPDPNLTTRERFAAHTENESCRSCHALIDPIGFGFEKLDAIGRTRETENGKPIDDSGELLYTGEADIEGPFFGARGLGEKLARSSTVQQCFLDQLFTFAIGRVPDEADGCTRGHLRAAFAERGDIRELLVAIAVSDAFRTVRGGE